MNRLRGLRDSCDNMGVSIKNGVRYFSFFSNVDHEYKHTHTHNIQRRVHTNDKLSYNTFDANGNVVSTNAIHYHHGFVRCVDDDYSCFIHSTTKNTPTHRYTAARLIRALMFIFEIKPDSLKYTNFSCLYVWCSRMLLESYYHSLIY